jgi:trk system potassium uptake protein TrkH
VEWRTRLIQSYRAVLAFSGVALLVGGVFMLLPILCVLIEWGPWEQAWAFGVPALALCGLGLGLWTLFRSEEPANLSIQEGRVVVLFSWLTMCLFSTIPFLSLLGLDFTRALFEAVSGWTTTGLTVIDVTQAPRSVLLWRSLMQFGGGAGLAILMLSAVIGPTGPGLYTAERTQQLVPHFRRSARLVVRMYIGYAAFGVAVLWLAGLGLFDALNHAMAAVSTGGFSTQPGSIGHWDSPLVEVATLPLMLLGSLNFLTAYVLLHGRWRTAGRSGELRFAAVLGGGCIVLVFVVVCLPLYPDLGTQVRVGLFETLSALTTTGFTTTSYGPWPGFGILVLLVLMLIGGGACSTAGGIKQYRIYLLLKALVWQVRRAFLPHGAVVENYVWQGDRKDFINDRRIREVATFVALFLLTYIAGAGVLAAHGYTLRDSLFEFGSAIGTVGLSVGVTGPQAPDLVLWAEMFGMLLGRLELFVIVTAVVKLVRDSVRLSHGD